MPPMPSTSWPRERSQGLKTQNFDDADAEAEKHRDHRGHREEFNETQQPALASIAKEISADQTDYG